MHRLCDSEGFHVGNLEEGLISGHVACVLLYLGHNNDGAIVYTCTCTVPVIIKATFHFSATIVALRYGF